MREYAQTEAVVSNDSQTVEQANLAWLRLVSRLFTEAEQITMGCLQQ